LTLIELFLLRIILFVGFFFAACHVARKIYNSEKNQTREMFRKFDRSKKVSELAAATLADPRFMAQFVRPKPRWVPRFIWRVANALRRF
jgi:hypothetical protein